MTKDEALKMALKFVEDSECGTADLEAAIKEALAQPEPEYLAFMDTPQRTWVGLTPDELNAIFDGMKTWSSFQITDVYFAIEAKLKEKNT